MSDQATGSLAGGILGGVLGFFVPVIGVPLGYALGSAIGGRVGAMNAPPLQGPRLDKLAATSANYGGGIPRIVGSMRTGGNVIWAGPLNEHSNTSGGKGGGGPKVTSYTYTRSFAVALCEGEADVLRIWAAKKLIYDATSSDPLVIIAGKGYNQGQLVTVYRGTETQSSDPTIQAYDGVSPPAYLGTCYIVINELDVTEYGGRLPPIEAEVVAQPGGTTISTTHVVGPYSVTLPKADNTALPYPISISLSTITWATAYSTGAAYARASAEGVVYQDYAYSISQIAEIGARAWSAAYGSSAYMLLVNGDGNLYYAPIDGATTASKVTQSGSFTFGSISQIWIRGGATWITYGSTLGILPEIPTEVMATRSLGQTINRAVAGTLATGEACLLVQLYDGTIQLIDATLGTIATITSLPLPSGVSAWDSYFRNGTLYVTTGSITGGSGFIQHWTWDGASGFTLTWQSSNPATAPAFTYPYDNLCIPIEPEHTYVIFNTKGGNPGEWIVYTEDGIGNRPALTLADLITILAEEAPEITSTDLDVTACTGIGITGYARTGPSSARDALSSALELYQVDCIESGLLLKFVPRSQAQTITVDPDDLGAHDFGAQDIPTLTSTRMQDADLPRQLNIHYLDPDRDLQQTTQTVRRLNATEGQTVDVQYPGALTATEAVQRADVLLRTAWRTRTMRKFSLPHTYLAAEPGDVLSWSGYQFRITRIDGAVPGPLTFQAVDHEPADYTSYRTGSVTATSSTVTVPGPTDLLVLDIPALRDADADSAGVYLAACGLVTGWPGAAVERSADGGASWSQIGVFGSAATLGVTTTALPDSGITTVWDRKSTVTVRLFSGTFASVTQLEALNGSNVLLIGDEILTAQNAVLNADGTYTLSMMLRGQQGTEDAMATHGVGERVVLASSAGTGWLRQLESASLVGATLDYRATTLGNYSSTADNETVAYAARNLKPWSPCHLKGQRDSSGNLTITWVRRTRYQTNWKSDYCPLGEASELYDLEILNGTTVVRTLSNLTSPTYTYAAADQTTDFGSTQNAVSINVYQRSAIVGRGIAASATV